MADGARGAGGERGRRPGRRRGRLHPDARGLARDPRREPRRAPAAASPTASSSRRRTTRPTTAASSTTRPTAARPTPTSRAGSRTRRTGSSRPAGRDGLDGIARVPFERARARASGHDFRGDLRRRPRQRRRHGGDRARRGCGSASTRWAARPSPTGGAIGERYGLDLTVTNDAVDPTFGVHDPRLGREDPHGPVVAVRDGPARGAARPVRPRARQRRRRGPPRDRRPGRRADEPQPRPRGGDRLPVRRAARRGARDVARRQDARLVVDHRPRGRATSAGGCSRSRSASSGSSTGSSTGRSGFGGEESAGASFLRRDGTVWTTDKDGIIACLLAAELTADRAQPGRGLRGADGAVRGARLPPDRRPGDARGRRPRSAGSRPTDVTATTLAGDPITAILTTRPATARRSAGSR